MDNGRIGVAVYWVSVSVDCLPYGSSLPMKRELLTTSDPKEIMRRYKLSRAQAYRALSRGYVLIREYPTHMPPLNVDLIAKRSAMYVCARQRIRTRRGPMKPSRLVLDYDLIQEATQRARIAIWRDADQIGNNEARAYRAGRMAALNALREWRHKTFIPLDEWLDSYEVDWSGSLDMGSGEQTGLDGQR